ncbi:MAG: transposase [Bacteroidota bacterium]
MYELIDLLSYDYPLVSGTGKINQNIIKKVRRDIVPKQLEQLDQKDNRTFSKTFRCSKMKEILEKRITVRQVSELYGVNRTSVFKWLYKYSNLEKGTKQVIEMKSESAKTNRALQFFIHNLLLKK